MGWTAIVLAGQRPGPDPLAQAFGEDLKALVPLCDEAMVTHVVRTLSSAPEIDRIIIVAQQPERLTGAASLGGKALLIESSGGISSSIASVAGSQDAPWPILVTTADHPLLTSAMISQFLGEADNCDLAVGMVERKAMFAHFPDAQRTWLKFSDGHWSGANLFALSTARVAPALALWAGAEQDRKTAWKLFLHFGPWLALRALTRTIGLASALKQAGHRLGLSARLVSMQDPVAAIDVDKLADHTLASKIMTARR